MCRRTSWCSELPTDPSAWSRSSPLPAPSWFAEAAKAFRAACVAAADGDTQTALGHLDDTQGPQLQDWFIEHAQNTHRYRLRGLGYARSSAAIAAAPDSVSGPDGEKRTPRRSDRYPKELEPAVFARDGWTCRYCGTPVVDKRAQDLLHEVLGPAAFPLGRRNIERHGIRLALTAVMDHVDAYASGGPSTAENLVTSCWCCNYGKGRHALASLALDDPRSRPPVLSDWDGASGTVPALRHQRKAARTNERVAVAPSATAGHHT